jgi:hypothetical protein
LVLAGEVGRLGSRRDDRLRLAHLAVRRGPAAVPLAGWVLFGAASASGAFRPENAGAALPAPQRTEIPAPEFESFLYALDTLLPVANLGQESEWVLADGARIELPWTDRWVSARVVAFYRALHVIAGWVTLTVLLAWYTGLLRQARE